MKLYHFTAAHMVESILASGITRGMFPLLDTEGNLLGFKPGCQWLTKDGDWDAQSWATRHVLSYDRTACRLQVVIPLEHQGRLARAWDMLPGMAGPVQRVLTDWPGSEKWYVFLGVIPPKWIREVERRPG